MAKSKNAKKVLDSYTVKGTHKVVKVGDCVLMRAQDSDKPPYVAKIEKIESDSRSNVKVRVRWYYRPEESMGGRRQFHGAKELFLSDHYDIQSADTIEGKCTVHTFKNYTKLDSVGADDYFSRFEYKASTGGFTPDRVAVYCKCEMPYNPDDLMVQCEACKDWFHSSCVELSTEQVTNLDKYFCADCSPDNHKRGNASFKTTHPDSKVCFQRGFANYIFLFCRFHPSCMNVSAEQVKKMEQFVCPECNSQPGDKQSRNSHKSSPQQEPKPEPKRRKR